MRDPRGRGKRFRAARCVERRARVANKLRRQCDSLWRRRRYPRQALGEETQFRLGLADGGARERDSSAPPRRSVRGAHGVLREEESAQRRFASVIWPARSRSSGSNAGSTPAASSLSRIPRRTNTRRRSRTACMRPAGACARRNPLLRSSKRHGDSVGVGVKPT